jgi:hypothetical protein
MLGKQPENQNDSSMVGDAEETQKRVGTPQRAGNRMSCSQEATA